ncbi:glycosyl hydrolase [Novosphingobium sp.]|uniref:glycosyl hydrolase n=1 Tax=Novosphingobium sp. TaxID=1874826 RepID=UPI0031DED592
MADYIEYGAGDVATEFPEGQHGFTDSNGVFHPDGSVVTPNNPVTPAVTDDFQGPPPTNSIFTPLAYHQYDGFTQWMDADPMAFQTKANGLQIGYTSTPHVGQGVSNSYSFAPPAQSLTLGLAGLSVTETKMAAQSDWTATADWGGKMRATMVQGGLFTYVNRLSDDDVVIDLNTINSASADTPSNQLAYTINGLNGSFNGQGLAFNFSVNAPEVADIVKLKVSYDFDGDGKIDRTELYDAFAIDANANGWEDYSTSKLISSTGAAMRDLANGSVKVELWRVSGNGDNVEVQTNSASSFVKLPYSGLTTGDGTAVPGSTLYLQQGAAAGDKSSTLSTAVNSQDGVVYDTTHVTPKPSIGGYDGPGQVWYNEGGVVGITINGQSYGIFANSDVTWTYTSTGLKSSLDDKNFYSVALLPDASVNTLMEYRQHAFAEVTGTVASYAIDKSTNQVVTTFTYTTQMMSDEKGLSSDPLTALYYHQYANSDASTLDFSFASARGDMKAYDGSSFSTSMKMPPILPLMPFLGTDAQKAELQSLIHDELKTFLSKNDPVGGDTYWGSRQIAKYTDLAMLAQQVGYGQAKDTFLKAAEQQLETWFTASDGDKYEFVYDKIWHAIIGYPGSYDADDKSNDLTLQLGYFVNAAATIATLDPEWAKQSNFGAMVNLIIKNANNPDRNDPTFGYLRGFDSYAGHNWASGTGFGITQESATESLNFDGAVARWGAATGQADMENLGLYLYTTESQAFADYYLDVHNIAFPDGFDHTRIGILGADGGSYATYFGTDPLYVQGINMTPILSQSSLFMGYYTDEIREDLAELTAQMQDPTLSNPDNAWWNSIDKYMAMADPDKALADYLSHTTYQGGGGEESRPDTLAFIESLAAMGTLSKDVSANSPYAAVYVKNGAKTYVAWNPSTTAGMTVTFSDGTKVSVGVNDMATLTPDGQIHITDFASSIAYRPDGIPLDLPTDPPAYALTTVATNGDMVLSVEATTGTAWLSVGGAAPRAMLNGDSTRRALQSANGDRLVAVGRDASGQVHVLLAGGANGKEPFYDKILDTNYSLKDNGAALYSNANAATLEPLYNQDFNGDGVVVGGTLTLKQQNGTLSLFVDDGNGRAYVKDGANGMTEIFRNGDGVPTLLTRGGSTISAVGKDADGNLHVLDVPAGSNLVYSWKLDAKGNWTGETAYDITQPGIADAEAIFQIDLNHDGVVPAALPQIVARNGGLQLLVDADGYALAKLEDGTTINVMRGGEKVKLDRGSQLSAIGRDSEGNLRVLDGDPNNFGPDTQHWAWRLDAQGNWVGEDVYSGTALTQVDGQFGKDFNGDGVISGSQKRLVSQNGGDALYVDDQTGKAFVSVQGAAPIQITRDGADWGDVKLQRGDWSLVAVATDDEGRTRVLDADPFSDMKYAWILDGNGHWYGEQSFDKSNSAAAEMLFSTDLNGDGIIGNKATNMAAAVNNHLLG